MESLTVGLDPTVVLVAMLLSQGLTWVAGRLGERISPNVRAALPMVAVGLAVGGAALVATLQGSGEVTWNVVGEGVIAGLIAVFTWVQGDQVGKVQRGEKVAKGKLSVPPVAVVFLLALGLSGCASGGDVTVTDLVPDVAISLTPGGCLEVTVQQEVPKLPEGYEATVTTEVRQTGCDEPIDTLDR